MATHESVIAGAVGFWACQDNTASTALLATTGVNATLQGGDDTGDKVAIGPGPDLPSSLLLNGTDDYISLPISRDDFSAPFAVGGWFFALDAQTVGGSEMLLGDSTQQIALAWGGNNNSNYQGGAFSASGGFGSPGGPFVHGDETWVHLAWYWDGSEIWTVRNGVQIGPGVTQGSISASSSEIQIGRGSNSSGRATNTRVAGLFGIEPSGVADIALLHAGPLPAHTGGSVTLSADLVTITITDTTTFAASAPNGTVAKTIEYEEFLAGQWEDASGFGSPVEGRSYRARVTAANDGGNDPGEDQASNTVVYAPQAGGRSPFTNPHFVSPRFAGLRIS